MMAGNNPYAGNAGAPNTANTSADPFATPSTGTAAPATTTAPGSQGPAIRPGGGSSTATGTATTPPVPTGPGVKDPTVTQANTGTAPTAPTVNFGGYTPTTTNGGLINTAQTPLANTTASTAQTWTPTADQTTSGQLSQILASNSPLMGQASLQADQAMAGRGLLNSSMTAGAEEQAMINSATPIAQSNAQTLAAAGAQNAQEGTQANLATAAQTNAAAQQQAGAQASAQQTNASAINSALQFVSQGNLTASQSNAGNQLQAALTAYTTNANAAEQQKALQNASDIANLQGQYSTLINTNSQFGTAFSSLMSNVASIYSNANITDPAAAAAPMIAAFQNYAQTSQNITGLNIAQNFKPAT